jgi:hypothetical protein
MCGAVGLRANQNLRVEGVVHRTIAKQEGQGFGLVPPRNINVELRRRIQNDLLNSRVNAVISVQNSGDSGDAYLSGGRDLSKSYLLSLFRF